MNWPGVRDDLVAAVAELNTALVSCKTEDDFRLVLEIMARYPQQALESMRRSTAANRIAEMRAAVTRLTKHMGQPDPEEGLKDPKKK